MLDVSSLNLRVIKRKLTIVSYFEVSGLVAVLKHRSCANINVCASALPSNKQSLLAFMTIKSSFINGNALKAHVSDTSTTRADSSTDTLLFLKLVGDASELKHTTKELSKLDFNILLYNYAFNIYFEELLTLRYMESPVLMLWRTFVRLRAWCEFIIQLLRTKLADPELFIYSQETPTIIRAFHHDKMDKRASTFRNTCLALYFLSKYGSNFLFYMCLIILILTMNIVVTIFIVKKFP